MRKRDITLIYRNILKITNIEINNKDHSLVITYNDSDTIWWYRCMNKNLTQHYYRLVKELIG